MTTLVAVGLYLVMALESGGSTLRFQSVTALCAVMAMAYVAALLLPPTREFFQLSSLSVGMLVTSLVASLFSMAALSSCGFTIGTATGHESR